MLFLAGIYVFDFELAMFDYQRLRSQPFDNWLAWIAIGYLLWLAVWLAVWVAIRGWLAVSGYRVMTYIGIRTDGLVWNRTLFFPREHIWGIGYGDGNTITMQIGLNTLSLATGLEPAAAVMFWDLFRRDQRRYWHGHN